MRYFLGLNTTYLRFLLFKKKRKVPLRSMQGRFNRLSIVGLISRGIFQWIRDLKSRRFVSVSLIRTKSHARRISRSVTFGANIST